jgi:hypothetical protein
MGYTREEILILAAYIGGLKERDEDFGNKLAEAMALLLKMEAKGIEQ